VRYGISNSAGTRQTTNFDGTDPTGDDLAFVVRHDTPNANGTNSTVFDMVAPLAGSTGIFSFPGAGIRGTSSNAAAVIDDTTSHDVTMTLTRVGDNITASTTFDTVTLNLTDTNHLTYTFDQVAVGINTGLDMQYRVDNVQLVHNTIPEPSALALLGAGALLAMRRRRSA
jgi:hypothetical protein